MANFAKAELLKYGWTEGKGLGKKEDGIVQAIRPKLKFDTAGLEYRTEVAESNWWESVFDKAAENIAVNKSSSGVSLKVVDEDAAIFLNKQDLKAIQKKHNSGYKIFLKHSTLENGKVFEAKIKELPEKVESKTFNLPISDEELFKACGGRTAHKGARHGLKLNGKLARIAQQEEKFLAGSSLSNEDHKKGINEINQSIRQESNKKVAKRKRKVIEILCEEDIVDEDNKDISHLLNTSKKTVKLNKSQKKTSKKRINSLVKMLDNSCKIEENLFDNEEKVIKSKKKKTSVSGCEDATNDFLFLKTEKKVAGKKAKTKYNCDTNIQADDYLQVFKDLTSKRYEEQDPEKFVKKKEKSNDKDVDKLSQKLDSMCSLTRKESKKKKKSKKSRDRKDNCDHFSKIDANKLNSRIQKKKRKMQKTRSSRHSYKILTEEDNLLPCEYDFRNIKSIVKKI